MWELQLIVCDKWIKTSVPCRRVLSIPNHFSNLESHCESSNCVSRPIRASTAPPVPSPRKAPPASSSALPTTGSNLDSDDEDEFQYGRSSSLPPEALSNAQPTPPTPSPMVVVQACPGSALDWPVDVGPFMETFPFHRIGVQQGSFFFNVEMHDRGTKVIAFSKECTGEARLNGCCSHCAKIPAEVQRLVDLAVQADSRVNHRYLSWNQIRALLADRTEEVRKWRLKASIVPVWSWILDPRHRADGLPPWRPQTLDAENLGLGLPSLRTLRNHMAFTKIMPTVGTISVADIIHNICEVVLKPREAAAVHQPLRGVSFLIDEVALEERGCHFRHNNSIGGLCWRHSPKVNLQLKTYDDALKIAAKIKAGEVHLGKEMTVVSVSGSRE
ncbi:hypothetical protein B0H13DRAFT_1851485 [Mycena leptocephala]|nr:hypothetical protein B0H13DRAFT_1851485 [Mycena leptocephala]